MQSKWSLLVLTCASGCTSLLGIGEPGAGDFEPDGSVAVDADTTPDADLTPDAQTETLLTVTLRGPGAGTVTSDPPGISCPGDCDEVFAIGQQVTLMVSTTDVFGGLRGAGTGCEGTGLTCTFDVTPTTTSVSAGFFHLVNLVFVTSGKQPAGSWDGVTNVDAFCQTSAETAGLPGSYRAWLPSATTDAPARLLGKAGWQRPDGANFAASTTTLAAGKVLHPPMLDEYGNPVPGDDPVVTETLPTGVASTAANNNHCENYSSMAASGALLTGEPAGTTGRWTQGGTPVTCAMPARYYCFQVDFFSALFSPPPDTAVMWLSEGTITPGGGFAAAQALCAAEKNTFPVEWPGFSLTHAMVTDNSMPVKVFFDQFGLINVPVQRPDGVRVADDLEAMAAGVPFLAPPNVTVALDYLDVSVWTGAQTFDTFAFDCQGWNSASGSLEGARRVAASIFNGGPVKSAPCTSALHVWCVAFNGAMAFLP